MNKNQPCPCASGQTYGHCCQRYWASSQKPATAEQLMRSRYSAFVLEKAQYLYDSHHPACRAADELKALKQSFRGMTWLGLDIVATEAGQATDSSGMVEFRAHFRQFGTVGVLHERSCFIHENGQWWYQAGELLSPS